MPRVNGRAIRSRLLLIGSVPQNVVKRAVLRAGAEIELADGIAHAIPRIRSYIRAAGIAGVRRFCHPNPQESYTHGTAAQSNCFGLAFPVGNSSLGKCLPGSARHGLDGIFARPVLDHIVPGIWFSPRDANAVHLLNLCQVQHHPLRMQRVALTGEVLREIRIALPESVEIAIGQPRESYVVGTVIARSPAPRQSIPVRIANHFRGSRRAGEISSATSVAPVAPGALRIPVPRLDGEFGVLTVRHRLPA